MNLKNLAKRVLVALFGIPIIFTAIWFGKLAFVALIMIISLTSQYEFYTLGSKKECQPLFIIGLIGGFLVVLSFYLYRSQATLILLAHLVLIIMIIELFRNKPNAMLNQVVTISGLIYPTALFSFLILIRESSVFFNRSYQYGANWVYAILIATWICDTAAYFIGSKLGRHKLFTRVSPNKTVEGAVGGFIFAILTMVMVNYTFMKDEPLIHLLIVGGICGIFGQIGDLAESLIKRDVNIKDSSAILPGHGGFLDRFDSLFFTAPIAFFYIKFIMVL